MANSTFTPIIIGVGEMKNASTKIEDAIEPAELMLRAIHRAIDDSGVSYPSNSTSTTTTHISQNSQSLPSRIGVDSIGVVQTWTWPYGDLPGLLADRLGLAPKDLRWKYQTPSSGDQSAKLVNEAARRIALGESTVAVVAGGEALASLRSFAKQKNFSPPGWTLPSKAIHAVFSPTTREFPDDIGGVHSIRSPIQIYPLFENGFRAHRLQSIKENNAESAQLYAKFSEVAVKHPYSWNHRNPPETESSVGTVTERNRMICFPYPLLMNAFNDVNLAAACLLTSTEHARKLGIPESQWIYLLGGAGTRDSQKFWERPNYFSSPAISRSIDEALKLAGLRKDDIDLFDFYSCFPIVPKIACHHLGLDIVNPSKPITLLGGLTSFGGAGNNYSMHAITEMTRLLRGTKAKEKPTNGLVLANGGSITYQHVIILSDQPPSASQRYPLANTLPEVITDIPIPQIADRAEGEAVIETYTVVFNRDGTPATAIIVGRLRANGHRFVANNADGETMRQLLRFSWEGRDKKQDEEYEPIGQTVYAFPDRESEGKTKTTRNLFRFEKREFPGRASGGRTSL